MTQVLSKRFHVSGSFFQTFLVAVHGESIIRVYTYKVRICSLITGLITGLVIIAMKQIDGLAGSEWREMMAVSATERRGAAVLQIGAVKMEPNRCPMRLGAGG